VTVPPLTPFQTVGPFFHGALPFAGGGQVAGEGAGGTRIVVEGTVRDGAGALLPDVLIETWQADADGRYNHPEHGQAPPGDPRFDGFGRVATGEDGRFVIETVKPGAVPGPGGRPQAPHIAVGVLGRGILTRLVTRIYFDGEPANDHDPVLQLVPRERRHTLIARRIGEGRYRFDIAFQGEDETVFFDV
jgi:protocatechuate 3,4-dioxygenase, alpha subunit